MKENKILIINPPRFEGKNVRRDERSADILETEVSPFYQGAVLAEYLRRETGATVKVLDANGLDLDYRAVGRFVEEHKDYEYAIIKAADDTLLHDVEAGRLAKRQGLKTLLWEPILSPAEPEKILRLVNRDGAAVDYLILGEAELTTADFLEKGEAGRGLAYLKEGKFFLNRREECDRLADLERLPIPDFRDLPVENYRSWFGEGPWMTLFTSRGCPGRCNFCLIGGSNVFRGYGGRIRTMSASRIADEVEILIKKHGVKHITFWDDCFTLDHKRVLDFCGEVRRRKLRFRWSCMSRADTVDEELLVRMKEAGLRRIGFGVESGSQRILDSIPKKTTVAQNSKAISLSKKHGIWVWIYLIVGLPEEDRESVEETIAFLKKSKPDYLFLGCNTPFPGTVNFQTCLDNHLFSQDVIDAITRGKIITGAKAQAASKHLTVKEVEEAKYRLHKAFVLSSPKIIMKKLIENRRRLGFGYLKEKINYFFKRHEDPHR